MARRIRVLVAKPGLDGHDRGAKVVARAFRDAGMEVIYTGLHNSPQEIVECALQEDVDAIGLSILSGAHRSIVQKLSALLKQQQLESVVVVVGGIIPQGDVPFLKEHGVHAVYGPGANLDDITGFVKQKVIELKGD